LGKNYISFFLGTLIMHLKELLKKYNWSKEELIESDKLKEEEEQIFNEEARKA